jgi:glycosyltransferase involved in cell wall biosynthesis
LVAWHHDLAWIVPRYREEMHPGWPWDLLREDWDGARIRHVAVSERRRAELASLFGLSAGDIYVIPSGLDVQRFFKLEAETVEIAGRLRLVEADLILLLPVRITRRKNIELAIRVAAALRASYPRVALVVTGPPGPHNPKNRIYLEELKALRRELGLEPGSGEAASGVHFLADMVSDSLPDEVISDFYRLADALILPSLEEGFGIPIIEAGLSGLPIFASDLPVLRELAGKNAYYFSPDGDPTTIAATVAETLSGLPEVTLKAKVRQDYTWDGIYTRKIAPLLGGL